MRKLLLAGATMLAAFPAAADPAYTISNMSCSKVQATVQSNGSVILRWRSRSGMPLYGRYVSDRRFCLSGESCQWRGGLPASDDGTTCERSGLGSTYMANAWCSQWNGHPNYYCDGSEQIYFP